MICRDLFSVQHYDHDLGAWVNGYITRDRERARRRHDAIRRGIWYGVHVTRARIRHPPLWVARAYVTCGTPID